MQGICLILIFPDTRSNFFSKLLIAMPHFYKPYANVAYLSVECFRCEQEFYDRRDRLGDEFEDVHGLPEVDLAKGWQMIFNDPEKLETFFTLDGALRETYM